MMFTFQCNWIASARFRLLSLSVAPLGDLDFVCLQPVDLSAYVGPAIKTIYHDKLQLLNAK